MNVSAIIVTRGNVPMQRIVDSLPEAWEKLVWVNGDGLFCREGTSSGRLKSVPDLSVYGRYAAIQYASGDLIYAADDDCVVSDPQAIVNAWTSMRNTNEYGALPRHTDPQGFVVCNMPPEFRHDFYSDHALVGFGACFHRDAPERAFGTFLKAVAGQPEFIGGAKWFERTCDIVFTALTPRVLVDVPYENLSWATGEDRMYRQPGHVAERTRMLELVRKVRDA